MFSRCLLVFILVAAPAAKAEDAAVGPHIEVRLVAEHSVLAAGQDSRVGILFEPEEHWHVYWINPGDTGLAPRVQWQVPPGLDVDELQWPFPRRIPVSHMTNLGFEDQLLLPARLSVSKQAKGSVTLSADVAWLVCHDTCIPGNASLALSLPIQEQATPSAQAPLFRQWQSRMPQPLDLLGSELRHDKNGLSVDLFASQPVFRQVKQLDVFVEHQDVVTYGVPDKLEWGQNWVRWHQPLNEYFTGMPDNLTLVLVVDGEKAYRISIPTE